MKKIIFFIIGLLIIGGAIYWYFGGNSNKNSIVSNSNLTSTPTNDSSSNANAGTTVSTVTTASGAQYQVLTIAKSPTSNTLYYNSTINPLESQPVISPSDGTISSLNFTYGQEVKKGQLLMTINSSAQKTSYQSALTAYLQAKQTYSQAQKTLDSDNLLLKNGLIPTSQYESAKNTLYTSRLTLAQAEITLKALITDEQFKNIDNISLSDTNAVNNALQLINSQSSVSIYAPVDGKVLFSSANNNSSNPGNSQRLQNGSQVKQGDILANINTSSGISSNLSINEININQLRVGQLATITSTAFPNITLNGYIKTIDTQAISNSSLPTFSAIVVVNSLTSDQQNIIKIGMSDKIAITTQSDPQILVPISAIKTTNGQNTVQVLDSTTGNIITVSVQTGSTTLNDVAITSGLNAGDQVVIPS